MKIFPILFFLFLCSCLNAQDLALIENKSSVKFSIKNFGLSVDGSLKGLIGILKFNAEQPEESYFNISLSSSSIDTGIDLRDKHLRKEDYLDSKNFPLIKFESQKVSASSTNTFTMTGILTIKKTSQKISFPFSLGIEGSEHHFEGQFKINRKDFAVGGNSLSLGDSVVIKLRVSALTKNGL
jgi:polyisoprenoid-binding protein YceI